MKDEIEILKEKYSLLQKEYSLLKNRNNLIIEIDWLIQQAIQDFDAVFKFVMTKCLKELGADYGHIIVKTNDHLEIRYSNSENMIGKKMPISTSLCGNALSSKKTQKIPDTQKHDGHYFVLHEETRSELAVPIRDYWEVKTFGILNIEWSFPNGTSPTNQEFCELLSNKIAIAWEENKLWEAVLFISNISQLLLSELENPMKVYNTLLKKVLELLDFDLGQILLCQGDDLLIVASSDEEDINRIIGPQDKSICRQRIIVERNTEPLIINDIDNSPYKEHYNWLLGKNKKQKMQSEFVVPLVSSDDRIFGAINIEDPRKNSFAEVDKYVISIFAKMIANTIEVSTERAVHQELKTMKGVDLIFANQSILLMSFLHVFGGKIANGMSRLSEFIFRLESVKNVQSSLPIFKTNRDSGDTESSADFLKGILNDLKFADDAISIYKARVNPKSIKNLSEIIELFDTIKEAIEVTGKKFNNRNPIILEKDISVINRDSLYLKLTSDFIEVLDCLLSNAIEASLPGKEIIIHVRLDGITKIELSVIDQGTGMSNEVMESIFDFTFSTKTNIESRLGQGMGLWYVKSYLSHFLGEITVNSILDKGSKFIIKLPIHILKSK